MSNKIVVEHVLRDIHDRHIGASVIFQGKRYPRASVSEIRNLLSKGAVAENFILKSNGFQGKNCSLDFYYFLTREEMEKKYENRWLILGDCVHNNGNEIGTILSGVVYADFSNKEYKHGGWKKYDDSFYKHVHTISGTMRLR